MAKSFLPVRAAAIVVIAVVAQILVGSGIVGPVPVQTPAHMGMRAAVTRRRRRIARTIIAPVIVARRVSAIVRRIFPSARRRRTPLGELDRIFGASLRRRSDVKYARTHMYSRKSRDIQPYPKYTSTLRHMHG